MPPQANPDHIREALLAIGGTVVDDFKFPLPGDLKDLPKAAALVSGTVEDRLPALLNRVRERTWDEDGALLGYEFRRSTIGFPDILLVERANPENVIFEIEAKSWYVLSGDALTARFLTSRQAINDGTLVAIVAWVLDGVVAGHPKLLSIHIDDAQRLAEVRDAAWIAAEPPNTHRVVEPENPPGTPPNQMRTTVEGQNLVNGVWRKNTDNFGKLDRLYDDDIRQFRDDVLGLRAGGLTFAQWRAFITG